MPDANAFSAQPEPDAAGAARARALAGAGPRAVERLLVAELERELPASGRALAALGAPVRVVVPSGALRTHLLARLARHRGAWLGLEVVTLRGLALAIVERAGERPPRGGALLPLLVRRAALREPDLARLLEPLEGGFAPLVGTVLDLLDAGLTPPQVDVHLELLADEETPLGRRERARAGAIVRVAARVHSELEALGRGAGAALYAHAARALERVPAAMPPARRWVVHGFADATGAVTDLLQAIARRAPTLVLLDAPPTATGTPRDLADEAYGQPLRDRLLAPGWRPASIEPPAGAELDSFAALGETAEAFEVARRIQAELSEGVAPEEIGVVARNLERHLAPLRRALEENALPFSVEGASSPPPELRAALSIVRILDERVAARADTVVDLLAPGLTSSAPAAELRLAHRVLGAATLDELARIDLSRALGAADSLALPVRDLARDEDDDGPGRLRSRRLPRAVIARFLGECRRLARAVADLPALAPARAHLAALGRLAHSVLPREGAAGPWLEGALARLAADLPADLELGLDEIAELVARSAEGLDGVRPGGQGGGVQVLSVVAARARTFARLYVVGLNRGSFPRAGEEDPLLGDAARRALREVLPDLAPKREGIHEERFLFDQLLEAAPRVTLSFPSRSDDASVLLASPLLDRLSWRDESTRALREGWRRPVPLSHAGERTGPPSPRARALRAGLARDRAGWTSWLAVALADRRGASATDDGHRRLARAHAAVLAELDPDPSSRDGARIWRQLGPFFGRVGPGALRRDPLYVTRVESVVGCGWKTFLERGLGLEPLSDPLLDLPAPLDPRLVGTGAHRALERLFAGAETELSAPLAARLASAPRRLPFPPEEEVSATAQAVARELLAEEGLALWGFDRLLAAAIVSAVAAAGSDWREGPVAVVGVEVEGEADLAAWGTPIVLAFRADRVDRDGQRIVLTDYKAWTPDSLKRKVGGNGTKWLAALRRGQYLQPVAYVAAFGGAPAAGRFLALGEDSAASAAPRAAAIDESASDALMALAETARRAAAAIDSGRLPPRLVDVSGFESGPICRYCSVAEACLQGDSGARRRLREWTEDRRASGPESSSRADVAESELVLAHDQREEPV